MFLIEGAPVVLLGLVVLKCLPDSFEVVKWLNLAQKQPLRVQLSGEEQRKSITSLGGIGRDPQVWLLVAIYFAVMLAVNTLAFWMPTLIHGAGSGRDSQAGLLSALPYLAGCLIGCGRSSERNRERRWQLCAPLLMAAAGIAMISSFGSIASFLAPYLIGWMRNTTQSASLALYVLALFIALGGFLVLRTKASIVNPQ